MANRLTSVVDGCQVWALDTTGVVALGDANNSVVSKWRIHAIMGGATPGSAIPKLRVRGSGLTGANLIAPIYYADTDANAIASGTAIDATSGNDIYEVICDGCDLFIDYTAGADGMTLYCVPVVG